VEILMAEISDIASYIYGRAPEFNVDPDLALGIARFEGLNQKTIGSDTFGNKDARGYSFGPFQLFSGSSDPNKIAPGGMAYEFVQKYGEAPSRSNWQQQVDFALDRMKNVGTSPWYAVRDRGGPQAVAAGGREYATSMGLLGPNNTPVNVALAQPEKVTVDRASTPVYSQDFGTTIRRAGNFVLPGVVDAPTPLTPQQAEVQRKELAQQAAELKGIQDLGSVTKGFLSMMQMGQQQPQEEEMLKNQIRGGQYRPLPTYRGLL
jgi:hypothetical protein